MRCRRQKLHPYTNPLASAFPGKHDSALLLVLRQRIHQDDRFPLVHFIVQHQQAAVRVHHHRLAHFAEFPSIVRAPLRLQPHLVKDALASPGRSKCRLVHMHMMRLPPGRVNCPLGQVSPNLKQLPGRSFGESPLDIYARNSFNSAMQTLLALFPRALYPSIAGRTIYIATTAASVRCRSSVAATFVRNFTYLIHRTEQLSPEAQ